MLKNILIILFLVAIVAVGAYLHIQTDITETASSLLSSDNAISSDDLLEATDFLQRFKVFESVQLDDSVFTDNRFSSLVDFRQPIIPTAIGRPNPYQPVN